MAGDSGGGQNVPNPAADRMSALHTVHTSAALPAPAKLRLLADFIGVPIGMPIGGLFHPAPAPARTARETRRANPEPAGPSD